MQAAEVLKNYAQIEYLSTTNNKWYKLKDYYPFAFPLEDNPFVFVLDVGGAQGGDFGHFKIVDNKLFRHEPQTLKWVTVTDIRLTEISTIQHQSLGITAVGEPFIITKGNANAKP